MLFSIQVLFCRQGEDTMMFGNKEIILKTRDLAILFDICPDAVCDMARRGHVKGFKRGNRWRFLWRDVERYIEQRGRLGQPG